MCIKKKTKPLISRKSLQLNSWTIKGLVLYFRLPFSKRLTKIHLSIPSQAMRSLQNKDGNSNFYITIHRALNVKLMFHHVFCIYQREAISTFKKRYFLNLAFTLLNLFRVWVSCCLIIYWFLLTDLETVLLHMLA